MGRFSIIAHAVVWLAGAAWLGWLSLRAPVELSDGGFVALGPDRYAVALALACVAFAAWYAGYRRMFRTPAPDGLALLHLVGWLSGGTLAAASADRSWSVLNAVAGYDAANSLAPFVAPLGWLILAAGFGAWLAGGARGARALGG